MSQVKHDFWSGLAAGIAACAVFMLFIFIPLHYYLYPFPSVREPEWKQTNIYINDSSKVVRMFELKTNGHLGKMVTEDHAVVFVQYDITNNTWNKIPRKWPDKYTKDCE